MGRLQSVWIRAPGPFESKQYVVVGPSLPQLSLLVRWKSRMSRALYNLLFPVRLVVSRTISGGTSGVFVWALTSTMWNVLGTTPRLLFTAASNAT